MSFILSCESTVDLPYSYISGRDISVLFYSYSLGDREYVDDMFRNPNALTEFYAMLDEGKLPSTSQINEFKYYDYFEELTAKGDVLHIAFGSGMTPSVVNAIEAASKIKSKYPDRKIVVIDSLCSCTGYGMLVDSAADLRDSGKSFEEVEKWVLENRNTVQHQLFSTDMKFFRRSGRVSGAAAIVGSILNICPIMHLNSAGKIIAYLKVRGKKVAISTTVKEMLAASANGSSYSGKCYISHSNCPDMAEELKEEIMDAFPNLADIKIGQIVTIIASHCGPGTVAVFFYGKERVE